MCSRELKKALSKDYKEYGRPEDHSTLPNQSGLAVNAFQASVDRIASSETKETAVDKELTRPKKIRKRTE